MVHIHAHLQRLGDGFRPVNREHGKQLLYRKRKRAPHALDRRNQQFGIGLDREPDEAGNIGCLLSYCHRLHESVCGSMTVRSSSFVSFSLQMCAPSSSNFFSTSSYISSSM